MQKLHFDRLKKIANNFSVSEQKKMICSLIFDEMHIRQQVFWSRNHSDYVGIVEDNRNEDQNGSVHKTAIVKQVIVFYLNGINTKFEYPVAYYLIEELNSMQRKDLMVEIISAITECGIRISNVTFDGLYCNTKSCEILGANLNVHSVNFQPYFLNPQSGEKIFIILDPCHMQKVVRNTLAGREMILYRKNIQIKWKHIVSLYEYSKTNNMRTHKLTKKHIEWQQNPMNVRLAVQTLSQSVANSMVFLKEQNHPDFADAGPSIEFIEIMNKLFDIFNSRGSANCDIFKQALSGLNNRVVFDFFEKATDYLKCLWINDAKKNAKPKLVQITKSRKKTAFRGYIVNMSSLKLMFDEFIENDGALESISTYFLQQDFLEMFFGKIRARGGFNNNPNVDQFKGAYRRLLGNLKIIASPFSNCRVIDDDKLPEDIHFSNIFFVSSTRRKTTFTDIEDIYQKQKEDILLEVTRLDGLNSCNSLLDNTKKYSIAYIASLIERKISYGSSFHCDGCSLVFDENEKYELAGLNPSESHPCVSTFKICANAERFYKIYSIDRSNPNRKQFDFKVIYCLIFRTMNFNELFPHSTFDCGNAHKYQFIKCIVGEYISIRATQHSKDITLDQYKSIFRHKLNRMIIFSGQ